MGFALLCVPLARLCTGMSWLGCLSGSSLVFCMGQYATPRSIIYRRTVTDFRYTQITRLDSKYFWLHRIIIVGIHQDLTP